MNFKKNTTNVKIAFFNETIKINVTEDTIVENVLIEICKRRFISPVTRLLFGLRQDASGRWLDFSYKILQEKTRNFEFALRYNVPNVDRLKDVDENAYDFYFKQARHKILGAKISSSDFAVHKNDLIGLSVTDMLRATIEDGWTTKQVIQNYEKYVPRIAQRKDRVFLKRQVLKKFKKISPTNIAIAYVKKEYLERFRKICPDYLTEEYRGFLNNGIVNVNEILIRVNPFDAEFPGVSIRHENDKKWEHFCTIDELVYLTNPPDCSIGLIRKNGVPLSVKFHDPAATTSFVTCVSGYYRLMVSWTFDLCKDYQIPSLRKLRLLKCHGPVGKEFAYQKLLEKRNNKAGCYILRESDESYDCYYIDICTTVDKPVTYKIEKTSQNTFKLEESKNEYSTFLQLLKEEKWENMKIERQECIPPSEYDHSSLLLICRIENMWYTKNESKRTFAVHAPLCIESKTVLCLKSKSLDYNSITTVSYGIWKDTPTTKREVIVKMLRENHEKYVTEFLSLINRWAFVNAGSVVKLLGVILSDPLSMITEYLPLGQLDVYLANPANRPILNKLTLIEASVSLANALYKLEEVGLVHGYVRCRKLLVGAHTNNSFVVKLADPDLRTSYRDVDIHWIPPEFHDNTSGAQSSFAADVWAFATTLWEIFSYGASPTAECFSTNFKKFYKESEKKYLPRPEDCPMDVYMVMVECWNCDIDARKKPHAIMRDINQIFYQVYNGKRKNEYDKMKPIRPVDILEESSEPKLNDVDYSHVISKKSVNPYEMLEESSINWRNEIYYQPNFSNEDTWSLNSVQSIFELDKEWRLILKGLIKQSHFVEVYKGKLVQLYNDNKWKTVAVKKVRGKVTSDFKNEIKILMKLQHPNIIRINGIMKDPELLLVLEFAACGSLQNYLTFNRDKLTARHLLKFALNIAMGMNYLSNMKIVHRNLSTMNILVINDVQVKISNFTLARSIKNENYYFSKTDRCLPIQWYAPEVIEYRKFSTPSDVWSYGVTLWEMFSYGAEPQLPNVENTADDLLRALKENIRLPMPATCPQYIYTKLISPCWNYDTHLRPSFDKLCAINTEISPLLLQ